MQLQHESALLDVYTKVTPDSSKTQLQAVLTAYYKDIKGIEGASGSPTPKFVKRRFEDPLNTEPTPEDCAALSRLDLAAAPAAVATEVPSPGPPPGEEFPAANAELAPSSAGNAAG